MTDIEQKAFDNFVASAHDWKDEQIEFLREALENYIVYTPSQEVVDYINEHPWEPLQVVRDRKICDYLYKHKGMRMYSAIDLWAEWEDFEFELREPKPVNA